GARLSGLARSDHRSHRAAGKVRHRRAVASRAAGRARAPCPLPGFGGKRPVMSVPCVLSIAGFDPSGGAGILADAEAIRAMGARPLCVATALTVQTTRAVKRWEPVAAAIVHESAHALILEENVRAIKIGMIADAKVAEAVLKLIAPRPDLPIVIDPVLESSSGVLLFKGKLEQA